MDFINILLLSMFGTTIVFGFALALTFGAVIQRFKILLSRHLKYGLVRIIGNDNRIRTYLQSLRGKELTIKKNTYKIDPTKKVFEDNVPILTYREGYVEPIDMLSGDIPQVDSSQLSDINIRAYSLGKRAANKQDDMIFYMQMLATGSAIAAAGIAWKILQIVQT